MGDRRLVIRVDGLVGDLEGKGWVYFSKYP
jgi:hypothetical protein